MWLSTIYANMLFWALIALMSHYYTAKGDQGISHVGPRKIPKTGIEIAVLGDLDELNSLLGVVKNQPGPPLIPDTLFQIQEALFIIQANVAALFFESKHTPPTFPASKVKHLEVIINTLETDLTPLHSFIVPGATSLSGWLDYARAVSRRAERSVLTVSEKNNLAPPILAYMNRLSSLLYVLARYASQSENQNERPPSYQ